MLVAVVKVTTTLDDAVKGTREEGTKPVTVATPPSLGAVNRVPMLSVVVLMAIPAGTAGVGPPIVTPAIVTVKEPAVTAAVVVIVTEVAPKTPMLAAKPVEATTGVVGVPVMYELG